MKILKTLSTNQLKSIALVFMAIDSAFFLLGEGYL